MKRTVLDTNVLVSGTHDDLAAGSLLLEACTQGELAAIVSPDLRREQSGAAWRNLAKMIGIE